MLTIDKELTLKEKIARMLICGISGTTVDEYAKALVQETKVGGIILYGRNTLTAEDTFRLTHSLQELASDTPLIIAIDEEHGRVRRIKEGTTHFVDMASVGRLNDPELSKKIAEITSKELIVCGINLNFAPVCDVNINLENEVIGDRSFSSDPFVAARMVSAYIEGGLGSGMILCAKHFPGHGDTSIDSHLDLPVVDKSFEALEKCELIPFRAALEAGEQPVMPSHILFKRIDDKPATMSKKIITDILIKKLMFGGVIISDDMEMGAITKNYGMQEAFTHSINAGVNMFIISGMPGNDVNVDELIEDIAKAVSKGTIDENKIDLSLKKILDLKGAHLTRSYINDFFDKAALRKESSLEFAKSLINAKGRF